MNKNQGFSLLEMVIAIFIIATVVAFSLVVMGKGMGTSAKSGDVNIATAIAENEMERVKNIPFPPTTYNGQSKYVDADSPYNNDFQVEVFNDSYDGSNPPGPLSNSDYDNTMLRKITINVYRKRDNAKLATLVTYIARNGTI